MKKFIILIGHRGVGKSSLLLRLKDYHNCVNGDYRFYDLDQYIESQIDKKISEIFNEEGEAEFRNLENKYFEEIIQDYNNKDETVVYISVGAGFMGSYPEDSEVIFVRRETDRNGRIFLNRPRLLSDTSAYEESLVKYNERQHQYEIVAHKTITLEEGGYSGSVYEKSFFGIDVVPCGGVYTLKRKNLNNLDFYNQLGVSKIELRTDLLSQDEILSVAKKRSNENFLVALRTKAEVNSLEIKNNSLLRKCIFDYGLELGDTSDKFEIISNHTRLDSVSDTINKIDSYKNQCKVLKLAISINSFEELMIGHDWFEKNPNKNVFLPMSDNGRWQWYRLLQADKSSLNFFKFDEQGSNLDQPYYYQLIKNRNNKNQGFSCILGNPVQHSLTPSFHTNYFSKKNMPVLNISLNEQELTTHVLLFLKRLGLRAAAVTSPLKLKMRSLLGVEGFDSVNTICLSGDDFKSTNTDGFGLKKLFLQVTDSINHIVLWGGGGVVPEVKKLLPGIHCYSARKMTPRDGESSADIVNTLVWAVGRKQHKNWPQNDWKPETVIDLNYSEDSPGKEYALMIGAKYINGLDMFTEQAIEQQKFWDQFL